MSPQCVAGVLSDINLRVCLLCWKAQGERRRTNKRKKGCLANGKRLPVISYLQIFVRIMSQQV